MDNSKKRVVVGLSGGVDSSFSAYLLKERGYQVEGVYLKLHGRDDYFQKNIERVQKVANFLDIPLHIVDLQEKFLEKVYQPFVETYISGETPNPCIICNREVKFGEMFKFMESLGADFLATGHYLKHDGETLFEATDKSKDQSYFLFDIEKRVIPKLLFPLGDFQKRDVKEMASKIPQLIEIAQQRESNEICFVENDYLEIVKKYHNIDLAGDVLNSGGEVVGKHRGYMHYTIGKRKGFTLKVAHDPHYVTKIFPKTNQIVVGKREELAQLKVVLRDLNMFISEENFTAFVKLRYRSKPLKCQVEIRDGFAFLDLEEPIYGLAKGQAGVFYRDEKVLGGGWIIDEIPELPFEETIE
jgi:tRNA-specific 2-thiouridylase